MPFQGHTEMAEVCQFIKLWLYGKGTDAIKHFSSLWHALHGLAKDFWQAFYKCLSDVVFFLFLMFHLPAYPRSVFLYLYVTADHFNICIYIFFYCGAPRHSIYNNALGWIICLFTIVNNVSILKCIINKEWKHINISIKLSLSLQFEWILCFSAILCGFPVLAFSWTTSNYDLLIPYTWSQVTYIPCYNNSAF